jgi:hypothetical protein
VDWSGRRRRRSALSFFGLTDNYKIKLHELLFDLTHFGKFEYTAAYDMPIHYRIFYLGKLVNIKEKEQKAMDDAEGKVSATPSQNVVKGPQINPRN